MELIKNLPEAKVLLVQVSPRLPSLSPFYQGFETYASEITNEHFCFPILFIFFLKI